jgi:HD superfamily phosphohydrolase
MSKIFNDPIHGRIKMSQSCVKIIDTVEFQRLRNLKQLGLTSYVFHGATHTRFEHSIGTCYIAGCWARHLQKKHPELGITDNDVEMVRIAALLHDNGHGPFSHTFEKFIKKTRPDISYHHEEMSIKIVQQLTEQGIVEQSISENVCKIIAGKSLERVPFLAHIVNNTVNGIDADKLDYFIRDSQCTSFAIGYDWKRIVYESSVVMTNNGPQIVFPEKMVGDIFNLFQIRFRLYKELYFHKTVCKIEDAMLDLLILADSLGVFQFRNSAGHFVSLAHSIDDTVSFLLTQDDIVGQMERSGIVAITDKLNLIKTRKFDQCDTLGIQHELRIAHYSKGHENPLENVTFVDKNGRPVSVDADILDSMCPQKFVFLMK